MDMIVSAHEAFIADLPCLSNDQPLTKIRPSILGQDSERKALVSMQYILKRFAINQQVSQCLGNVTALTDRLDRFCTLDR